MIFIEASVQTAMLQSAIQRAAVNRAAGRVPTHQADGSYVVPSANTDAVYTVRIVNLTQLQASCTCPHGNRADARGTCWHKMAAMAEEVIRLGGTCRMTRPGARRPRPMPVPQPTPQPKPAADLEAAMHRLFPNAA